MKFCNYALVQIVQLSSGQIERSGTMQGSTHARQCDSSIAKVRQRKSTENGNEKKTPKNRLNLAGHVITRL